jgi:hypothetical protein
VSEKLEEEEEEVKTAFENFSFAGSFLSKISKVASTTKNK